METKSFEYEFQEDFFTLSMDIFARPFDYLSERFEACFESLWS